MVKKKLESYTKEVYNGKAMLINSIKQNAMRFLTRIIAYSVCASSKNDKLSTGFIYATCWERASKSEWNTENATLGKPWKD